ncbi:nuclear transport factor 2 family protein [Winogradskyella sp.]|uniref:nuclear transport factor 2 family protein n=1 Tax=Winogradskyella sp. TaxID=1883156 RepID=UPI003F6AC977
MKYILLLLLLVSFELIQSQNNTEIFLFDIQNESSKISLKNGKNISNNQGYDNQPAFYDDRYILFASTRNEQTDISKYDTRYNAKSWLNFTEGGEYTPLNIPEKNDISAVRLDKDGKQRLYKYSWSNGESDELIEDLIVAYYTWFNNNTVVSAVIESEQLNLYTTNVNSGKSRKYATNVGRSFHRIPNSNLVSFISKENDKQWQIKSLNPETGSIRLIANTIEGVEDICWLDSKTLLSGNDSKLYKLTLRRDNNWKQVADLAENGITKITRLSINPSSTKLLIAGDIIEVEETIETSNEIDTKTNESDTETNAEPSDAEKIVQLQLDAYNARYIDAFMSTYTKDVKLYNYPNKLLSEGQEQMRKDYTAWFERTPDLRAFIKKRIVIGNKVIDEEQVTANGQVFNAVAIYEVENGKITKVTFIQ